AERIVSDAIQRYLVQAAPELGQVSLTVHLDHQGVLDVLDGMLASFEISGGKPPWEAPQLLTIRLADREGAERTLRVSCRIERLPSVVATRYAVPRGHVLQAADLILRQ